MISERLFVVTEREADVVLSPAWLFDVLAITFDLDPCGALGGDMVPAEHRFTVEDDGLTQSWFGRVWLNPPFSDPSPFTDKFIEHGHGIAVTPASKAAWHRRLWRAADGVAFTDKAIWWDGRGFPYACMLWAFGEECVEAIGRTGLVRKG